MRESAREIQQKIELIAIVHTEVGINVPDQNRINRADTALGVGKKTVHGVFAGLGVIKSPVPDQQLHLRENVLGPSQVGPLIFSAVVSQAGEAIGTPGFQAS